LPAGKFLNTYARYFNAVEIDSTFYGTPRRETILRWKAVTPVEFKFCLKTPREITHDFRLIGAQAFDSMMGFLEAVSLLEEKLGTVLLQFAPSFQIDQLENLGAFLERLPPQYRYAVEFRHRSWYQSDTIECLKKHHVSWASTEYPNLPEHVNFFTKHVYIRWIGHHGRFQEHTQEHLDKSTSLRNWKARFEESLSADQVVFGFFNNDYAGFAPATCNKFKALMGLPHRSFEQPIQGTLF
jgi:uncharacterized protein YecE (DUF72 family)